MSFIEDSTIPNIGDIHTADLPPPEDTIYIEDNSKPPQDHLPSVVKTHLLKKADLSVPPSINKTMYSTFHPHHLCKKVISPKSQRQSTQSLMRKSMFSFMGESLEDARNRIQ